MGVVNASVETFISVEEIGRVIAGGFQQFAFTLESIRIGNQPQIIGIAVYEIEHAADRDAEQSIE